MFGYSAEKLYLLMQFNWTGYILDEDDLPGDVQDYNRRRRKKPYQAHFPTKHD